MSSFSISANNKKKKMKMMKKNIETGKNTTQEKDFFRGEEVE
jgi:hypothetical protein